jgi:proteasome accessory factor B
MPSSRIHRLVRLLLLLQGARGHDVKSLATQLGVGRRTVFRDLATLRTAGVELSFDPTRNSYAVADRASLAAGPLTATEAAALLILCHELTQESGVPLQRTARSALLKLEAMLPERMRAEARQAARAVKIRLEATNLLERLEETYQTLLEAVIERRAVRVRYESLSEATVLQTKLHPYQIVFFGRSWYVLGRSSVHRGVRTFNLGRFQGVERLDETFPAPERFSLGRHLRNAWRLVPEPGRDSDVHVRFSPRVARNVAEVRWHPTQRTEARADGGLDFFVRVSGIHEISWWIQGYGDEAEVLAPAALRRLIVERCRRVVERDDAAERNGAEREGPAVRKSAAKKRS